MSGWHKAVFWIAAVCLLVMATVQGAALAWRSAERYVYEVALPRIVAQVQVAASKAVQDGIRNGAGGALSDATGGLFGRPAPSLDPCAVPAPVAPAFGFPRLR